MTETVPGIDFEHLTPWFSANIAPVSELRATIIGHGRSNLTYRIEADGQSWVLRRQPLSHVLPTAHDMKREFRVISALQGTAVPVPKTIALCEDATRTLEQKNAWLRDWTEERLLKRNVRFYEEPTVLFDE